MLFTNIEESVKVKATIKNIKNLNNHKIVILSEPLNKVIEPVQEDEITIWNNQSIESVKESIIVMENYSNENITENEHTILEKINLDTLNFNFEEIKNSTLSEDFDSFVQSNNKQSLFFEAKQTILEATTAGNVQAGF